MPCVIVRKEGVMVTVLKALMEMIWKILDIFAIILLVSIFRKKFIPNNEEVRKRSVAEEKGWKEKVLILIEGLAIYCPLLIFIIDIIAMIDFNVFVVGTISIVTLIMPKIYEDLDKTDINVGRIIKIIVILTMIFISTFVQIGNIGDLDLENYRTLIEIVSLICFTLFLTIEREKRRENSKKYMMGTIRKDLYNRSPLLEISSSYQQLDEICQHYFLKYKKNYLKIAKREKIKLVEYANIAKVNKEYWFKPAIWNWKIFWLVNVLITVVMCIVNQDDSWGYILIWEIFFISCFKFLKSVDLSSLEIIVAIYNYDLWGYFIKTNKKVKFIGTVQLLELTKYHVYVHSMLDVAALCRAVAYSDMHNENKMIQFVSKNFNDLYNEYFEDDENWVAILPVWIAAMFEFKVVQNINSDVKKTLNKYLCSEERNELTAFLESFWKDMMRTKNNDKTIEECQRFINEIDA